MILLPEKISVDEEKRTISVVPFLEKLDKVQVYNEKFIPEKDKLVAILKNLLPSLGLATQKLKQTEAEIMAVFQDELLDDLYDDFKKDVQNHITYARDMILMEQQITRILANYILTTLEQVSELSTQPIKKSFSPSDEGEPVLSEEERAALKQKAMPLILKFKDTNSSWQKMAVARFNRLADTKEKLHLYDDIFLQEVGERLVSKFRKEQEKKNAKGGIGEAREHGQDNQDRKQA